MAETISFDDFTKIDIRIGTIIDVQDFPKAKKTAYQLTIDFGALGIKRSSAQITALYTKEQLMRRQITAVVNFAPKQIANFLSECLVLGVANNNGDIVLLQASTSTKNGNQVN